MAKIIKALAIVDQVLRAHNIEMEKKKIKRFFYIDMISIDGIIIKSPYQDIEIKEKVNVRIGRNIIIIGEVSGC